MDADIIDARTASVSLAHARDNLAIAEGNAADCMDRLRDTIVQLRPMGVLTVNEMAEAIGRDRNYVDSVWSAHGETTEGKQTRVPMTETTEGARQNAVQMLADAARNQRGTATTVGVLRAERDRLVALVYASKILGPTAIAHVVQIDRNHVLRIARKAGVKPMHRTNTRNQHTAA